MGLQGSSRRLLADSSAVVIVQIKASSAMSPEQIIAQLQHVIDDGTLQVMLEACNLSLTCRCSQLHELPVQMCFTPTMPFTPTIQLTRCSQGCALGF